MKQCKLIVILLSLWLLSCSTSSNNNIGYIQVPPDDAYSTLSGTDPKGYECMPANYIDTGPLTSPGLFKGGCPGPLLLIGSWGPGKLYHWEEFIKMGETATAVASVKNVMGLPNGIAMIHWNTNNLSSTLNNKYSVEMITGWGGYDDKVLANDYGWVNGTILNFIGKFQNPFIHIFFREVLGTTNEDIEEGRLHFWELLLDDTNLSKAETLYPQLKTHIETYWDVISGNTYPDYKNDAVPEPLKSVINGIYYMALQNNQQIPSISSDYWTKNNAYPKNNFK